MTLSDVAAAAGVSPSTASRVLNGGKPVSAELDERVRRAAARVGYVSNAVASAMRGRRGLLAILTDELGAEALAELAIAAGEAATRAELTTTVSSAGTQPEQQLLALRVLRSLRPRAIVLTGGWISDPSIRGELEEELADFVEDDDGHVVVMGPPVLPYPTVSFDDYGDGFMIGEHMGSSGGASALIMAGPAENESYRARAAGIVAALNQAGIEQVTVVNSPNESHDAESAVTRLSAKAPPAMILCVNDRLALGVYAAVDGLGLRIPEDIKVSGVDDLPVAHVLEPGLTTVTHPLSEAGPLVVELALSPPAPGYRKSLRGVLVIRGSSGSRMIIRTEPPRIDVES